MLKKLFDFLQVPLQALDEYMGGGQVWSAKRGAWVSQRSTFAVSDYAWPIVAAPFLAVFLLFMGVALLSGILALITAGGMTVIIPWAITYRGLIVLGMDEGDALWPSLIVGFVVGFSVIPLYLLVGNLRRTEASD